MAKYRKKPVVVEAVQLRWDTVDETHRFAGFKETGLMAHGEPEIVTHYSGQPLPNALGIAIPTQEGVMIARENDWIIKGVKGEIYPCKPDIFEATYEALEAD